MKKAILIPAFVLTYVIGIAVSDLVFQGINGIFGKEMRNHLPEVWYMDGSNRIGSGVLLKMADLSWKMIGIGDFNLDGENDILWRRYTDGQNMIWYMYGITRIGYEYIETRSDLNWRNVSNSDYKDF